MGMSDYSNGMNKPMVCRPSALSKDPSDRTSFLDKVTELRSLLWLSQRYLSVILKRKSNSSCVPRAIVMFCD